MVDSAALLAIQQVDLFLLGADAVLATGFFVNKVGSGLFALAAEWYHVPLYVVCHTLKFDPQSSQGYDEAIEERAMDEVWPERPEGVHILNPAFEKVPIKYVEAFVTERGLLNLHSLQEASQTFTV
jgi:methylthioribose-1-phosphate isomerase